MTVVPAEKVVFAVSFESMFIRALGDEVPPALKRAFDDLKLDLKHLQPAYPVATWKAALAATRQVLHPKLQDAEAYEHLGKIFIRSYFETLVGRAVKPLLRVIGTTRSLERMRMNFRGGNNFSDTSLEKLGDRSYQFWMNDDLGHPSFVLGIIQEGMNLAVEPTFTMKVIESKAPEVKYSCTWS